MKILIYVHIKINNKWYKIDIKCNFYDEYDDISFKELYKEKVRNILLENYCLKLAGIRMSQVIWTLEQILFMSMDRRLAQFLLEETDKIGDDNIKLTHEQIARYIGSAREVVSRMLKYFEQEGLVRIARGNITLLDKEGLKSIG